MVAPEETPERGWYLYALTPPPVADVEPKPMHPDSDLITRPIGSWIGYLERVDLAPWTGPEGEQNLQELEWVAPRAVHHEEVVEQLTDRQTVFPLPFATIFATLERLRRHIDERDDAITRYFQKIGGQSEWAIKGLLDRSVAETYLGAQTTQKANSGLDYLKARKQAADNQQLVDPWLDKLAPDLFDLVVAPADDHAVRTGIGRQDTDDGRAVVFNWAMLADETAAEEIASRVDQINERLENRGLELELTGPWPPYSFRPEEAS